MPTMQRQQRSGETSSALDEAKQLLDLVNTDPVGAVAAASELLDAPTAGTAATVRAVALRARGLARAKIGEIGEAVDDLRSAVDLAHRAGSPLVLGEVLMSLGGVLSFAGSVDEAVDVISEAIDMLDEPAASRARVQRAAVLYRRGDLGSAQDDLDAAAPVLEAVHDGVWLAHLHSNRGIVLGCRGDAVGAERDLLAARELFLSAGQVSSAAEALQNLGWVASIAGDIPMALRYLDAAEEEFVVQGHSLGEVWGDRCDTLISAHLTGEAMQLAAKAARELRTSGMGAGYAETEVRLAKAALLGGHGHVALEAADRAVAAFERQGRQPWVAQAMFLAMQARAMLGELGSEAVEPMVGLAAELESWGLTQEAVHARLLASRFAVAVGRYELAGDLLEASRAARHEGRVDLRVDAWLSAALLRLAVDDRRGTVAAVVAGLRVVDQYRAVLGASEMRAHVSAHAERLSEIGIQMAIASGRPRRILSWMERSRAGSLRFPPVHPPDDVALAAELASLRQLDAQLRTIESSEERDEAERRRQSLQESIRRRSRAVASDGSAESMGVPGFDELASRLGRTRTLVEIGIHRGATFRVVVRKGCATLHSGGSVASVAAALDALRFSISRITQRRGSAMSLAAARASADAARAELGDLLLGDDTGDSDRVVIVPPASLHAVPWTLLPSLEGRAVSVSPSAGLWVDRSRPVGRSRRGVVVANGPDLPGAAAESRRVAELHPAAMRFTARNSSVDRVLGALDGARLAHIVAHGSFRSDNPLFSSLRLADGGLTVYDLERIDRMPPVMVLSACNSGLQAVRPANETMGIVAALLGAGCRTVVASTGLVADTPRTTSTMVDFHERLVRGSRPAVALAEAQQAALASGDDGLAAAPFVCFGAG